MPTCYAIGIGGSGSKTLEALIHLCTAGLGPDQLKLGFVDPDKGNGNLERAKTTLEQYREARAVLPLACNWQRTQIELLPNDGLWSLLREKDKTLYDLFLANHMQDNVRNLFDGLLLGDEREQKLPLHEGFRGRPNIGAAVFGATADEHEPFWQALLQSRDYAQLAQDVRLFLVGSVFGGTGAAGFPVIARLLRNHLQTRAWIGGALLLPYFAFPGPAASQADNGALSTAFQIKSQESLKYYAAPEVRDVFDDLYLIGWPNMVVLDDREPGGKPQHNPPLMPELYAALAAARFFAQDNQGAHRGQTLHIGYDSARPALGWSDLPGVRREDGGEIKTSLGQALRFAHAYSRVYGPLLQDNLKQVAKQYWFKRLLDRSGRCTDLRNELASETLRSLDTHCRQLLRWAFSLQEQTNKGSLKVSLLKKIGVVGENLENGLLSWKDEVSRQELEQFDQMIADVNTTGLDGVLENLHYAPISPKASGLGCFVECLFTQCALS